jgi:hypothetical protein
VIIPAIVPTLARDRDPIAEVRTSDADPVLVRLMDASMPTALATVRAVVLLNRMIAVAVAPLTRAPVVLAEAVSVACARIPEKELEEADAGA